MSVCEKHGCHQEDWWECPGCVREERDSLRRRLNQANLEWAEDHEFVREATRKVLHTEAVDGDSHFVPTVQDFAEMLCAEIAKVREEMDMLRNGPCIGRCQSCGHEHEAPEDYFRVREERDRLRSMIVAWCRDHKWCASEWKHEPTNMALFEEAGKEVDQ